MSEIQLKSDINVELVQMMGGDHMAIAAAKVSTTGTDALAFADAEKQTDNFGLINYLIKHRHGTPFEHAAMTFFVHAPIFVWREWHRHRIGFSYNEESGRYKQLEPVFYLPSRDRPMIKVSEWKPGRPKFLTLDQESNGKGFISGDEMYFADSKYDEIIADMKEGYAAEYARYLRQLDRNLDPGLARDNLPVGIYSGCWVTCNPRSLMSFLSLRTHEPTADRVSYPLHEIEVAARKCEAIFSEKFPLTHKAFVENGRVAP